MPVPEHVQCVNANGKAYFYYQSKRSTSRAGERITLPGHPTTSDGKLNPEWWNAYRDAVGLELQEEDVVAGTFAALIDAYKKSPEWKQRSPRTIKENERHLAYINAKWGKLLVAGVAPKHVVGLRDTRSATPADANNLQRTLSALCNWASLRGWRGGNPCSRVPKLKIGEGWAPWPWEWITYFRTHAAPRMWQAAALALYTGQRLSDVVEMRRSIIDNGLISVVQNKTGKKLWIPIHRELQALLDEILAQRPETEGERASGGKIVDINRGDETILTTTRGKAWTAEGFKASWSAELNRDVMKPIRKQGLVFHGLRKSAVVFLLEAGCTDAETAAITGQSRDMVEHYAKQVNQKKLAAAAILKWEAASEERKKVKD